MNSCLYSGTVRHRRAEPVEHEFRFPLFLVYLELEELDEVFAGRWLWSTSRPAFARFARSDHLGDESVPLDESVRKLVEQRSGQRPDGPIRLLTQLRTAGYVLNPVSFYYCFDRSGEKLQSVVADVTNTPWNERHTYVVQPTEPEDGWLCAWSPKEFHVSPFMGMDCDYRWTFTVPGERLAARIENFEKRGSRVFDATLTLERQPITTVSLARALTRHPFMAAQTTAGIYWQALRLLLKRAPFHPHPEIAA
jgi:hypothetical protein